MTKKEAGNSKNTKIVFKLEKDGYDKKQVDSYINGLSALYKAACDENKALGKQRERDSINADIAVKTLINAELLAEKIIKDAQEAAAQIVLQSTKIVQI